MLMYTTGDAQHSPQANAAALRILTLKQNGKSIRSVTLCIRHLPFASASVTALRILTLKQNGNSINILGSK
jgi:hypothetical protein